MCDVKKYKQIYEDFIQLNPDDTLQLIMSSETPDEQDFFSLIGDFLLQKKQREVIKAGKF